MTKAAKLTKAQREILEHCSDWSAPFEIANRRHAATGEPTELCENVLGRLRNLGFVECHRGNWTFRITDAGRAALKEPRSDQQRKTT